MAGKRNREEKKTTNLSTAPVGALVPQPHGGALRNGGTNRGGPGHPPSVLRARLRGSFSERVEFLESVADGEPVQTLNMPLARILSLVNCPKCAGDLKPESAETVFLTTVAVRASASTNDRLKAVDLMAKYGLGSVRELTTEHVRDRLLEQVAVIRNTLPPELAEPLLDKLSGVWS